MRLLAIVLVLGSAVVLPARAADKDADARRAANEKTFKEFGAWIAGGVWTGDDSKGYKVEARNEWILGGQFLRVIGKDTYGVWIEFLGIDPETGRWADWGFDEKGRVWTGIFEAPKAGEWTLRLQGRGKDGPMTWNARHVKIGDDKLRWDLQEITVDGKRVPATSLTVTRAKDAAKPAKDEEKRDEASKDQTATEKAFREYASYSVGGVWAGTDHEGKKFEARAQWILGNSFCRLTEKFGDTTEIELHGIDPATGKWAYWNFASNGSVGKGTAEAAGANEWAFSESGRGKSVRESSLKFKVISLGQDKLRVVVEESVADGKKLPNGEFTLARQKETRPRDGGAGK